MATATAPATTVMLVIHFHLRLATATEQRVLFVLLSDSLFHSFAISLSLCTWLISSATTTDFLAVSRRCCCSCFAYCCYCYCSFVVILSNYLVLFTCVCTMRRRRLLRTRAEDGLKHEAHCGYEVTRVWVTRKDSPQATRFVFEWVFYSPVPCWWCKSRRWMGFLLCK